MIYRLVKNLMATKFQCQNRIFFLLLFSFLLQSMFRETSTSRYVSISVEKSQHNFTIMLELPRHTYAQETSVQVQGLIERSKRRDNC